MRTTNRNTFCIALERRDLTSINVRNNLAKVIIGILAVCLSYSCTVKNINLKSKNISSDLTTIFDSVLIAKYGLTLYQYRNKVKSLAFALDNYKGYENMFDESRVFTAKFPPIFINGGSALEGDVSRIKEFRKYKTISRVVYTPKSDLFLSGRLDFVAQ